jgi:hypothetical protein
MEIFEKGSSGALFPHSGSTDWTGVLFLKPFKDTVLTEDMSTGKGHWLKETIETDGAKLRVHSLNVLRGGVASVFL